MTRWAALFVLLGASSSWADDPYWVAVGSFSSQEKAEQGRDLIGERLLQPLSVVPADNTAMPRYRVLMGPYASREEADQSSGSAFAAGIVDAWILQTAQRPVQPDALSNVADYSAGDYTSPDWASRYDDLPLEMDAQPLGQGSLEPREKVERVLVEEAPADYQLHRLRRD